MRRTAVTVPRTVRVVCAVMLACASLAGMAPSAYARESTFRISLTLRGSVAADASFGLGVSGFFYDWFCVSKAQRDEDAWQDQEAAKRERLCRSGATYAQTITLGNGESAAYGIGISWLRSAGDLWSGTLTGDGRNHRLSYVYDFDLPATDAVAGSVSDRDSAPGQRSDLPFILAIPASVAWWLTWSWMGRRRRTLAVRY